jgi:fructose-specific phosphotransferase system IIC component
MNKPSISMKRKENPIRDESFIESAKVIIAGLFAGIIIIFISGLPVQPINTIERILSFLLIILFSWSICFGLFYLLNKQKHE